MISNRWKQQEELFVFAPGNKLNGSLPCLCKNPVFNALFEWMNAARWKWQGYEIRIKAIRCRKLLSEILSTLAIYFSKAFAKTANCKFFQNAFMFFMYYIIRKLSELPFQPMWMHSPFCSLQYYQRITFTLC